MSSSNRIQLVIFDWAGTTVDYGCFAPVAAFIKAFATSGIDVTATDARGPMGLHKRDHIREILQLPRVAAQWRTVHSRDWSEADVERLYEIVTPLQVDAAKQHADIVPGLLECVASLRSCGVKIGSTTGYPRQVAEPVIASAKAQGYSPDCNVCADEVPAGRPAPWMIHRNMEALGVYPSRRVVKVGDTVPDIEEALNAGAWSIGVIESSSEVGCTLAELQKLSPAERATQLDAAKGKLKAAGAHAVISSLAELPSLLDDIERRLKNGERP